MAEILGAILAGGAAGLLVVFLLRTWLEARIKLSIQHEYNQQLEIFKRQLDERRKIELVAALLAEWIAIPKEEPISKERRTLINRLSFESTLWLPAPLATELSRTLQGQPGAKNIFEIVLLARQQLTDTDLLTVGHVTAWGHDMERLVTSHKPIEPSVASAPSSEA